MKKKVVVQSQRVIFERFIFRIIEAQLRYMRYDGTMSAPIKRLNFDRGDSVAMLVVDRDDDTVLLTEQFKYPTYDPTGERGNGWIIELPAGKVDEGETAEAAARRELVEETGYEVNELHHINTFYLSPGGTSERIILYYALVTRGDRARAGGGLEEEGEDIKVLRVKFADTLAMMQRGELPDAKTILALQWLQLRRMNDK